MREALRNPNDVLNSLSKKATDAEYKYERLYRNFYNPNFYLLAYQHIYNNKGSMTKGVDDQTLNGMGMERIFRIIENMKNDSYIPNPVRRVNIPKKNGKTRPLGIPSADDKLIQEVLRMILESIYEPTFSNFSHGFRLNRSCHTALEQIQKTYTGIKWFVEGDIKGCFDNIDQHILVGIIRKRIKDERLIALIWKFLKAGYMDNWEYHNTYSGAAQGSIISPLFANIYMNELDVFMTKEISIFNKGTKRANNSEYNRRKARWYGYKQTTEKNRDRYSEAELNARNEEVTRRFREWNILEPMEPMDEQYRRLLYCRYADDFLIGVIGSKSDAREIKEKIRKFLAEELKLELSEEKTLITHSKEKARFLGFDITTSKRSKEFIKRPNGRFRMNAGIIKLYVPRDKWIHSLLDKEILYIQKDATGKKNWMPVARSSFVNRAPIEIISTFNSEIRGLYNYYAPANNVSVLNKFYYVMEYSMYKTFACKYRKSMTEIKKKYTKNHVFAIPYVTPKGVTKTIEFYHDGFRKKEFSNDKDIDNIPKPTTIYNFKPNELIVRMLKGKCEMCHNNTEVPLVYQVSSLSTLREEIPWEKQMIKMRRKTLIMCESCFVKTKTDM